MYVTPFGLFIMMIIERSQRGVYAIAGIKLVLLGDFCFFFLVILMWGARRSC